MQKRSPTPLVSGKGRRTTNCGAARSVGCCSPVGCWCYSCTQCWSCCVAPVIENIAPAPTVILPVPSQQLPSVFSTAAVATDVNLDISGLVNPQFSGTAVEASAPQAVVSVPPFEEFTEPVYSQVHHEQIVAGEMTQDIIGISAVQEQVIVQEVPPVVEQIQEQIVETIDVTPQRSQFAPNTSSTSTSHVISPARAPRRPATTVLMHLRACLILASSSSRSLKGLRRSPSCCWSLLRLNLLVLLLQNAVVELGTPRCQGSWNTQCTWLQVLGRRYGTLDFVRARD